MPSTKSKKFRKLPFLSALLSLFISFFAEIPFGLFSPLIGNNAQSVTNLSIYMLQIENTQYFPWGLVNSGHAINVFLNINFDTFITLLIWSFCISSSLFNFLGSSYDENPKLMKKLINLSTLLSFLMLIYYISIYLFMMNIPDIIVRFGPGLIILSVIIILDIMAFRNVTDYNEIQN